MLPLLALITGPAGKIAGYAALAIGIAGGAALFVRSHDNSIRAALIASQDAVREASIQKDNAKIISALTASQAEANALRASLASTRKAISNAPNSSACATSPAIVAAIGGLRTTGHH